MKSKIAFISEHASPLALAGSVDSGGQNIYVREVARELSYNGYQVDIYTRRDDAALPQIVDLFQNVRVIHADAGPPVFVPKEDLMPHMEEFTSFMIKFIRAHKISYELVHANFWMSGMVAQGIKAKFSIPYVITFHALGLVRALFQKEADKFPKERSSIERSIMHFADQIIAECPQDEEDMIKLYHAPEKKIEVIPCGFNPDEFHPLSKKESRVNLGLPLNEHILLQLGRMVPRKGIDNVIRAIKHIPESLLPVRLLIVGGDLNCDSGPCAPELKRLKSIAAEEGVSDQVVFTGPKPHSALKHYYSASDIFISTPWYEPFGITPIESMACGTPVIGSDVGGIKFTVADGVTGFLVPPKSPEILASRIAEILTDKVLANSMSEAAIRRANKHFTWERVAYHLKRTYQKALNQSEHTKMQSVSKNTLNKPSGVASIR
jgi:glycosyltransferase involved in cell wall biosynthesis